MKDKVITDLRLKAKVRVGACVNEIKAQIPHLSDDDMYFIASRLAMVAVDAVGDVMELTPQQFNAVRTK